MNDSRLWALLARKYNNEISEEELAELELLLKQQDVFQFNELLSDLHKLPLEKITTAEDALKSREAIRLSLATAHIDNTEHATQDDHSFVETVRASRSPKILYAVSGVAAACFIVFFLFWHSNQAVKQVTQPVAVSEVVTNGGSKSTVHLPDGSLVILNTGSKLVYNKDFGVEGREIYLTGEAFFDIAHNEKIPLTVHAGNVDIKVKGTAFNVKAYSEDSIVEAALIRGSIEVFSNNDPERKILLRPNEKILIGKSSTITSSEKDVKHSSIKEEIFSLGKIKPNPSDSSISEIAWIENKLAFYKEPFESLAKKMERWYNVSIHFTDDRLEKLTFTGSFEKEDIVQALDALRQSTPFQYTIENRKVIIKKNK
jgi:transmembrane sensor